MDRLEDKEVTEAMNKCPICGGPLEARKITHPQKYDDKVIILENVPALVCRQCGEVLLTPDVVRKMQRAVWSQGKPKRSVQVPVYDLTEVA